MTPIVYAIGDVHGRDDLLATIHDYIQDYHEFMHPDHPAQLVHLGDYVDGGPDSITVIDRLRGEVNGYANICLLGNHEAMMLACLESDDPQAWNNWQDNGGNATLASLSLSTSRKNCSAALLRQALGTDRIAWLRSLPRLCQIGRYVFVHAGIRPLVPIEQQDPNDLIWIRGPFLESDLDHGFIVVHGHTPADEPVVKPNRICVDTGATSNGILTAAVLNGSADPVFLRAKGPASCYKTN